MKKTLTCLFVLLTATIASQEKEESFQKPNTPFRNVAPQDISRSIFYTTNGIVTTAGNGIPNYNMGLGFRHQRGSSGVDLNLNLDNCFVVFNAQMSAAFSLLQYLSPKMDEVQYYFGEGLTYTQGRQLLEKESRKNVAFGLMWGREVPLNWRERKFFQINVDFPVAQDIAKGGWQLFEWEIPSVQVKFGRSF